MAPAAVTVDELLEVALRAAAEGAAVLAARDPGSFAATEKSSDADWVTAFDVAAENAVRAVIGDARPHDVITGEELAPELPAEPSGYRWSIDPLDGTMNFIRNIAYHCTSVAVAGPDGQWLAGVVNAPALRRVYFATRGGGAWLDETRADGVQSLRALHGPTEVRGGTLLATAVTNNVALRRRLVSELNGRMDHFGDFRRLGSAALELCAVAEGGVDGYLEYGLFEHDFAAAALIAEEAGAWVHRPELSPAINGLPSREEVLSVWTGACVPGMEGNFAPAE
ncbi:inositol monophosphatase family protein [Arthrobacter sp.]|uniref:inositol monophosphatase family protein n=1 Tax=Arthrobacter sp. TaxID=1667 RepID=UPI0026DFE81F|nr:inositol monophosphatase family protein [Arthrobacter sp.]MDO5753007.1 inositol monophosphatase family protein [Arthrobacter sp.]